MTEIKRYACDVYYDRGMYDHSDGDFVSHDDHAAIVATKDARISELETMFQKKGVQDGNKITALQDQARALAAENSQGEDIDLYVAIRTMSDIEALDDKHLTICYMTVSETSKLNVNEIIPSQVSAKVTDIVYWERVNLTVALIDSEESKSAYQMLTNNGFTYDLDFIPHVTIGKGDKTEENINLIGKEIMIGNPYIRLRSSKKETPTTTPQSSVQESSHDRI